MDILIQIGIAMQDTAAAYKTAWRALGRSKMDTAAAALRHVAENARNLADLADQAAASINQ